MNKLWTRGARTLAGLVMGVGVAGQAAALDIDLGNAANYSAFVFEDVSDLSDIDGRLAVGGNLSLPTTVIGSLLPSLNTSPSLVVRGDVSSFLGGFIWAGSLKGFGLLQGNKAVGILNTLDLRTSSELPVDFDSEQAYLGMMSAQLRDAPATGTVSQLLGFMTLKGSNADVEVFNLTASQVSFPQVLLLNNVRSDAYVIVNVAADSQRKVSFSLGSDVFIGRNQKVLFNFHDAETVNFNLVTVRGSVLAVDACICVSFGRIDGTVVARQWKSAMSVSFKPFLPNH